MSMPTGDQLRRAEPALAALMADSMLALKSGEKSFVEVADRAVLLARDGTHNEPLRFLLYKGAMTFYVLAERYDTAADVIDEMNRQIGEIHPWVVMEIIASAAAQVAEARAPRLYEQYRKAKQSYLDWKDDPGWCSMPWKNGLAITGIKQRPVNTLEIPASIGGTNVVALSPSALNGCEDLQYLSFPSNWIDVSVGVFDRTPRLKVVLIPGTNHWYRPAAFNGSFYIYTDNRFSDPMGRTSIAKSRLRPYPKNLIPQREDSSEEKSAAEEK